jgi:release factor glutamine methyltransferase
MMNSQVVEYDALLKILEEEWRGLPDKPEETPKTILNALWHFAGASVDQESSLPVLGEEDLIHLRGLMTRYLAGEPLAFLIGYQDFAGLKFMVGPDAMIPRKETELLARTALQLFQAGPYRLETATVIDLCTGSGNVGLFLAKMLPSCLLYVGDISPAATGLAQQNAIQLGLESRTKFLIGDFLEPFRDQHLYSEVCLMTCNPPYVSTRSLGKMPHEITDFEPRAAFDGGPFGLSLLMRLVKEAPCFMKKDGWVVCETGLGQGEIVANMFHKSGHYRAIESFPDDRGNTRVIAARV